MESYLLINLLGNYIYSTFFAIFIYGKDYIVMPWWGNLIAYIVPSVLTCLVTLYISRKSQVNTNTETLFKLVHQLKSHKKKISEDNNKLNLRINQLEQKIAEQTRENEKLKNHISALENENRKLKSKIQYISNPQNHRSGDDDREL